MDWKDALSGLRETMPEPSSQETAEPSRTPATGSRAKGKANIFYEKKGRGGKEVTIIADIDLPEDELKSLASDMKKQLGTGGSQRGGEILIQGDRRRQVKEFLTRQGYKTNI